MQFLTQGKHTNNATELRKSSSTLGKSVSSATSSGAAKRARGLTRGLGVVVWAYSFLVSPENTDILAWIVIDLASEI